MIHPIHEFLGQVILVAISICIIAIMLTIAYAAISGILEGLFGRAEQLPVLPERSGLESLPIGSPRDGGNNFYADGWQKMTQEQAEVVRQALKLKAKEGARDHDGWDVRMSQPDPTHPEMILEVLNDVDGDFGPDDLPDDDEVERPDERKVLVSE